MSLTLPKCDFCKHYIKNPQVKGMCCEAYPEGIPLDVMNADESKECKNGIKYEEE